MSKPKRWNLYEVLYVIDENTPNPFVIKLPIIAQHDSDIKEELKDKKGLQVKYIEEAFIVRPKKKNP